MSDGKVIWTLIKIVHNFKLILVISGQTIGSILKSEKVEEETA
jgi:hypothetical protein